MRHDRMIALTELSAGRPDGIILQLPLPAGLDENAAMARLDPDKDVDGFHPLNLGRLVAALARQMPGVSVEPPFEGHSFGL